MIKPRKLVFLVCCAVLGSAFIHQFSSRKEVIAAQSRIIQIGTASGPVGGTINVPIELIAQGDENAIGFSLTFDAAVLSNPVAALGSGATGATFNTNNGQAAQGRFGVALAFPANQKFAAGKQQMVVVTFSIAANANFGTTNLGFGDQPVQREVADTTANALTATFTGGSVMLTKGFEADVTPRPDGDNNGTVTITDWVQVGRFVAGLDTAATGSEFQRADCAPRSGLGDGRISIIDWTQAGRYAAALDPATAAGGPTAASSSLSVTGNRWAVGGDHLKTEEALRQSSTVHMRQRPTTVNRQPTTVSIEIEAQGIENALGFSLIFNASHWRLLGIKAGHDLDEAVLQINSTQAERGRVGVALAMPVGKAIARGERELLICEFAPIASRKGLPFMFDFGDFPVKREMADVEANPVHGNFSADGLESETLSADLLSEVGTLTPYLVLSRTNSEKNGEITGNTELLLREGATLTVIDSSGNKAPARVFWTTRARIDFLASAPITEGTATGIVTNSNGDSFRTLIEIVRQ